MTLPYTLQQLRIVKAIASEHNFTKASERLYISQLCLSKQVKNLEEMLGVRLITRTNNKTGFTEAGKIFLTYSERILALCEESCRALNDLHNGDRGDLNIGASQTIGTYLIPRVLALFVQTYPQIKLKVQVNSTRVMLKNILNHNIDIAIVGGHIPKIMKKKLRIESFVEDEFLLIIPKLHPFAMLDKKIINKNDLYNLNFITLHSNSTVHKHINQTLRKNHIETNQLKIVMQLDSIEAIKAAVSLGLGVAFVSSAAIEKELTLKSIEIIDIRNFKIKRTLSIVTNPNCKKSRAFEFFYKELLALKKSSVFKEL